MTDAEIRHHRRRRWRTVSEFLVLGFIAALCTWGAAHGATLRRPMLSEDLQDTPKGFHCVKTLVENTLGHGVRGFRGPFYGTHPDGSTDPTVAAYGVIERGNTTVSGQLRFFASPPHRWRYFSYGASPSKVGVFTSQMETLGEMEFPGGSVAWVNYTPCLSYLGSAKSAP